MKDQQKGIHNSQSYTRATHASAPNKKAQHKLACRVDSHNKQPPKAKNVKATAPGSLNRRRH